MKQDTIVKLIEMLLNGAEHEQEQKAVEKKEPKPSDFFIGRRCLIRTYSAGVHIGKVEEINEMEVRLSGALRLWQWKDGGLSLSAVANNGINGGRLNYTGEVLLTNAIEIIPTTKEAEQTYVKFIED